MNELSQFGQHLAQGSGIGTLMDDLGEALASGHPEMCMLGGGQPAHIPEVDALWRRTLTALIAEEGKLEAILGNYDPPQGNLAFREALADCLHRELGWELTADHIAITNGGQTAFFFLLNALAGPRPDGASKKILLPLVPEYIGYASQGVSSNLFTACPPLLKETAPHRFKYQIDFEKLTITEEIAAICLSRPTNPTGNVVSDQELAQLRALANEHHIPLIIDNAYGAPFPHILFRDISPVFGEDLILTLSLSKLGLPGTRTGIVIASPEIAKAVSSMTSIIGLSNGNLGQALTTPLLKDGSLLRLSKEIIQPYYLKKSKQAQKWLLEAIPDHIPFSVHESEGALFLWIWFKDLPVKSQELYERLKVRHVLIIPGHHFFFGIDDPEWKHQFECIRLTYSMPEETVRRGIQILAEEIIKLYSLTLTETP